MGELDPAIVKLVQALARSAAREDHARAVRICGWLKRVRALEGRDNFKDAAQLASEIENLGVEEPFRAAATKCKSACERAITGQVTSRKLAFARNSIASLRAAIEEVLHD